EITAAMEKAVTDGKTSFSRSGSVSKNVSWLSLIIPNDANIIKNNLQEFKETKHVPQSLKDNGQSSEYFQNRYDSSIKWIETNDHAVISNGPFYLESYSPESRTIKVKAFEDDSYPFKKGAWSVFEKAELPMIKKIDIRKIIQQGEESMVTIDTQNTDSILYFLTDGQGTVINSNKLELEKDNISFDIVPKDPETLEAGVNSIKIFAISNSVSKPDYYESSFMVTESKTELPASTYENIKFSEKSEEYGILIIIPVIAIIGILIYVKSKN
ncbi:ABC transporter substrate-binding protein, partial [archaeon]|nr:ABC transporter substrate-binding protein [archaeon]